MDLNSMMITKELQKKLVQLMENLEEYRLM